MPKIWFEPILMINPEEIVLFDFFVNFNIYLSYKLKADKTAVLLCNNFDRRPLTARKTEFGVSSSVVRIEKLKILSIQKSASTASWELYVVITDSFHERFIIAIYFVLLALQLNQVLFFVHAAVFV